jgi:hypothetical protein
MATLVPPLSPRPCFTLSPPSFINCRCYRCWCLYSRWLRRCLSGRWVLRPSKQGRAQVGRTEQSRQAVRART